MKSLPQAPHYWSSHKNTTKFWLGTDSQEQFELNFKDSARRTQLQQYGYDQPDAITYVFNSHGFRCEEFDHRPGIIALGCSQTAGVGVQVDQTWPNLVAQRLALTCWNLAVGAASMDTCMRLLYHYIDLLNPRLVLLLKPSVARLEIFDHDTVRNLLPAKMDIPAFQKIWYSNDINSEMNSVKNTLAIEHLCATRCIPLIIKDATADLLLYEHRPSVFPGARDMQHAGPEEHWHCAQVFIEALN
jgi:hypothetical protein